MTNFILRSCDSSLLSLIVQYKKVQKSLILPFINARYCFAQVCVMNIISQNIYLVRLRKITTVIEIIHCDQKEDNRVGVSNYRSGCSKILCKNVYC